jgi:hypothetical protein
MRHATHQLIGIAFWLLLIGMWIQLLRGDAVTLSHIGHSVQYVAVVAGAVLAVTLCWVRHNIGIHRRKGPRTAGHAKAPRIDEDRLGRPLRWSVPGGHRGALDAAHLVVEMKAGTKVYRRP